MSIVPTLKTLEIPESLGKMEAIAFMLAGLDVVLSAEQLVLMQESLMMREETATTYLDNGLAVPHGRAEGLDTMHLVVGRSYGGIRWGDEGELAKMVVLFAVPKNMVREYLSAMQSVLRWYKVAPLDADGGWTGTKEELHQTLASSLEL